MNNKKTETSSLFLYSLPEIFSHLLTLTANADIFQTDKNESRKYVYGGSQVIEIKRREQFGYTVIPIKDEGL